MPTDITSILQLARDITLTSALLVFIRLLLRGDVVPRSYYTEASQEALFWRERFLQLVNTSKQAVDLVTHIRENEKP